MRLFRDFADRAGVVILAPEATGRTWDVIERGGFGPDVGMIDDLLAQVFHSLRIDPKRMIMAGFSDGGSYALSLGLTNGDLFTHVIAFSPGFIAADDLVGAPAVFIAHGVEDGTLPIDRTSRQIVPRLRDAGYEVRYEEFLGRDEVRPSIARAALRWALR
jgi:phospholipase/carboxylesterase